MESVRARPAVLSSPFSRAAARMPSSTRLPASASTRRSRNSDSTEKSKPGSASSNPRAYLKSILARTASAACRSVSPSTNCNTSTNASRPGDQAGLPRAGNRSENSRTRIARLPFGNAARATRTVSAGISPGPFGCIDIDTHPIRQRRLPRPQPGLGSRRHARARINQQRPRDAYRATGLSAPFRPGPGRRARVSSRAGGHPGRTGSGPGRRAPASWCRARARSRRCRPGCRSRR